MGRPLFFRRNAPEITEQRLWEALHGKRDGRFGPSPEAAMADPERYRIIDGMYVPIIAGGSPLKSRYKISEGLGGYLSGWDIPGLVEYDFSAENIAGASTTPGLVLGLPPATNAGVIGSSDDPGPALTVATTTRAVGSGQIWYATLLASWIFSRTLAGAVYAPAAGSTLKTTVVSTAAGAVQIASDLTAAFTLAGLVTFWTRLVLTVPAERQPSLPPLGLVATAAMLFYGDSLLSLLLTTSGLNIQGNTLANVLELA